MGKQQFATTPLTESTAQQWLMVITVLGVFLVGVFWFADWMVERSGTVIASHRVGEGVSAQFSQGAISDSTTAVSSTGGTFLVRGAFHVIRGNPLVIEDRKNGDRMLCDHAQGLCKKMQW